jgi:exopolysaccharide production protein ExoQ
LRELVRIFGYLVLSVGLASRFKIQQLIAVLTIAAAVSVCLAVTLELATASFRPWLPAYRLTGSVHSNALAQQTLFLGLAAFYYYSSNARRHRRLALATLVGAFVVIVLTKGRAALIALPVALIMFYTLGRSWRRWALPASIATTAAGIILLAGTLAGLWQNPSWQQAVNLGREKGYADVGSLTGRLPLWEVVWRDVSETAWRGRGLAAYWTTERIRTIHDSLEWYPRHAHSIYVQTLADLGIIGVGFLLATALLAIRQAIWKFRSTGLDAYRLVGSYLIVGMLHGLVESAYVVPRDLGLFVGPLLCSLVISHQAVAVKRTGFSFAPAMYYKTRHRLRPN